MAARKPPIIRRIRETHVSIVALTLSNARLGVLGVLGVQGWAPAGLPQNFSIKIFFPPTFMVNIKNNGPKND
jgi:hypothetical protein